MRKKNVCLAAIVLIIIAGASAKSDPPPIGLSLPCEVVNVIDGDTVDVKIELVMRVRMLECWAPETRTRNLAEKERGLASKAHLQELALGEEGIVFIPMPTNRLQDLLTFDRVLGYLWVKGDNKSLNRIQVETGHATRTK